MKPKMIGKHVYRHLKLVIVFTIIYWIAGQIQEYYEVKILDNNGKETDKSAESISLFNAFYFSLVTQTTVGYGNHVPITKFTQVINTIQLLTIFGIYLL